MNKHNVKTVLTGIFTGLVSLWIPMLTIAPYIDVRNDPFYISFPMFITTLAIILFGIILSVVHVMNNWKE